MRRVLILVEGQTEERFVKEVLAPEFWSRGILIEATLLVTKRVKDGPNFKGGVTNFDKFRNDANRLLRSASGALVTTMLDYYRLPTDFPGMETRPLNGTPEERVCHVEAAVRERFGSPSNFLPFFSLHEFEAWLFCSCTELPKAMTEPAKQAAFASIIREFNTPEEINERPEYAPSKRIVDLFPAYQKTLHGPLTAGRIGLVAIRAKCPHFDKWLKALEAFGECQNCD